VIANMRENLVVPSRGPCPGIRNQASEDEN
jgi:hypothetical protein